MSPLKVLCLKVNIVYLVIQSIHSTETNVTVSCEYKPGYELCVDYFDENANTSISKNDSYRIIGNKFYCACDERCVVYNDCCANVNQSEILKNVKNVIQKPKCVDVNPPSQLYAYLVNECPRNYNNEIVKKRCETSTNRTNYYPYDTIDEDLYLNEVIVYSNSTKFYYGNIFCALCNNDYGEFQWFHLKFTCTNFNLFHAKSNEETTINFKYLKENAHYNPSSNIWFMKVNDSILFCGFKINSLEDHLEKHGRQCYNAIDSCSENWVNESIANDCKSYTNYIYDSMKYYKNIHCAICNNKTESLNCSYSGKSAASDRFSLPAISSLLDLNFFDGNLIGKQSNDCSLKRNKVLNPITKQCMDFNRLINDSNIDNDETISIEINSSLTWIKEDCKAMLIEKDHFSIINQTFIYVNITQKYYNINEFHFIDENVVICNDDLTTVITDTVQSILSLICMSASVICLTIHIIVYLIIREFKTIPGKILISLSASILTAHTLFIVTSIIETNFTKIECVLSAVLMHYFYLCSFCWMNVMSFNIYFLFKSNSRIQKSSKTFINYSIYSWGAPLIIVALALINEYLISDNDYQPKYGLHRCWISQRKALLIFFAIPLLTIITVNVIFFGFTVLHLLETKRVTNVLQNRKNSICFQLYAKLCVIMGFTWIFGFIAAFNGIKILWYPFIIFNGLQGVFIFLSFSFKARNYTRIRESISSTINSIRITPVSKDTFQLSTVSNR